MKQPAGSVGSPRAHFMPARGRGSRFEAMKRARGERVLAAIHQLHYLPWLRYLEKMARADIFIALDDVHYTKNGFQNRNKIKHPGGWMYLTVPVRAHAGQLLSEIEIAQESDWNASHWRAIQTNYGRAPFFPDHAPALAVIFGRPWTRLNDLNWELLMYLRSALGITTPILRSSELSIDGEATDPTLRSSDASSLRSTSRLVAICRAVGADHYYSGSHAAEAYLDEAALEAGGIELVLQTWSCPTYEQRFPQVGFIPDLSVIDLLLNQGPQSRELILAGGHRPAPRVAAPFRFIPVGW